MFDNLRDSASDFYEEEPNDLSTATVARPAVVRRRRSTRFLGLTAQQRFILSVLLMLTVCVVGVLAMFVLGRMSLF
ncbi:MAG: hypothetical protein ACM3Y8_08255 [Byssovorax cruenta]|jgi:hypothetical protein